MKLTNSQEEYLKTIYILENSNQKARVTDIAKRLQITKPSVNKAINVLKEMKLVESEPYKDITLTKQGQEKAQEILKRYDTLKIFLMEVLELDCEKAQEEAQNMKHAMSKETEQKLDKYISKILNLGDLDCNYDQNSEKCRNCVKITAKNRLKKQEQ